MVAPVLLRMTRDFRRAMDLSLVLDAERLPHELRSLGDELWALSVDDADASRADAALRAFESENPVAAATPRPAEEGGVLPGLSLFLGLLAFHVLTGPASDNVWFRSGSADAARIVAGELSRCVTALTLHADAGHAAGNALLGGFCLAMLARRLGAMAASFLVLLAGSAGTLLTALLLRSSFTSIGASTAVFAAIGALAALRARDPGRRRQAWVYLAAGMALLGFLGSGRRADAAGHALGFLCGVVAGALVARLPRLRSRVADGALAALAPALVALAWWRALGH